MIAIFGNIKSQTADFLNLHSCEGQMFLA